MCADAFLSSRALGLLFWSAFNGMAVTLATLCVCMYSKYKDEFVKVLVIFKCYQPQQPIACVHLTMELLYALKNTICVIANIISVKK